MKKLEIEKVVLRLQEMSRASSDIAAMSGESLYTGLTEPVSIHYTLFAELSEYVLKPRIVTARELHWALFR